MIIPILVSIKSLWRKMIDSGESSSLCLVEYSVYTCTSKKVLSSYSYSYCLFYIW